MTVHVRPRRVTRPFALATAALTGATTLVVAGSVLAAPAAQAACPTDTYVTNQQAVIVERALLKSQAYDNRGQSQPLTGQFVVTQSKTAQAAISGGFSYTGEVGASLFKIGSAKVKTQFGVGFEAKVKWTNDTRRAVNANVPGGKYWIYKFGVDKVKVVGTVYRDTPQCKTEKVGTVTLVAPTDHYVFWIDKIQ